MEDDLQKLEAELLQLSPAAVPESLEARIFAALDSGAAAPAENKVVPFPIGQRLGAAAAVLVACVGMLFAVLNNFGTTPGTNTAGGGTPLDPSEVIAPSGKNFVPASADNTFRGVSDGGIFLNEDGQPVRELRYQFSDSYRWTDQSDGSELELIIPHERSYLVPVPTD